MNSLQISNTSKKVKTKPVYIRDLKDGFYANILKIPANLETQKTVAVGVKKRIYVSKYKRFYYKTFKYLAHCDLKNELYNPAQVKQVLVNQKVYCVKTRRFSANKSMVLYFAKENQ